VYIKHNQTGFVLKRLLIIAVILTVIIIGVFSVLNYREKQASSPENRSKAFIQAVVKGEADVSYDMFATANKTYTPLNSWKLTVARITKYYQGDPQPVATTNDKVASSNGVRQFRYRIAGKDGTYILTVFMTNSDGQWRVLQFNSAREKAINR
jgi:uncharacterized protein (UPF0333 family)